MRTPSVRGKARNNDAVVATAVLYLQEWLLYEPKHTRILLGGKRWPSFCSWFSSLWPDTWFTAPVWLWKMQHCIQVPVKLALQHARLLSVRLFSSLMKHSSDCTGRVICFASLITYLAFVLALRTHSAMIYQPVKTTNLLVPLFFRSVQWKGNLMV